MTYYALKSGGLPYLLPDPTLWEKILPGQSTHTIMKTERIVLSVIAILIGLFVAGIVFYFFQMAGKKTTEKSQTVAILPTPTVSSDIADISISSPDEDEITLDSKSVKLIGRAPIGTTVVISQESGQDVVIPDSKGEFSKTLTLDDGVNLIHITALHPNGKSESIIRTISYSTETF